MKIRSTEFFQLLARRGGYLFRPSGQGVVVLKEADGRDMVIKDEHGRQVEPVLPVEIFDDFQDADLVRKDDSAGANGAVYWLTAEGRARGNG
jgi:hypothetical protein